MSSGLAPGTFKSTDKLFYLVVEEVKRSMEWLIKRLIEVGAKVAYHGRRWYVHVASAFPSARYYKAVFGYEHGGRNG